MSARDADDRSLPAPLAPARPAELEPSAAEVLAPAWDDRPEYEPPPRTLSLAVALRAMRRYWWQILGLWLAGSVVLGVAIQYRIRPGYEATAWLKVEPAAKIGLTPTPTAVADMDLFMQTQVQLLTSPDVLGRALIHPDVAGLGWVRQAPDPQTRLHDALRVLIPPKTSVILVSMTTPEREESARIVNAVVRSYLDAASSWVDRDTWNQLEQLKALKERYRSDMERYRRELELLVNRTGSADPNSPLQVAAERYRQYRVRLGMIEMERLEAEVAVGILDESRRRDGKAATTPEAIEAAARLAFLADPEVAGLTDARKRAEAAVQAGRRLARNPSDAAIQHQQHRVDEIQAEIDQLWAERREEFLALAADAGSAGSGGEAAEYRSAELRLAKLRGEEEKLRAEVEQIHGESRTEGSDTLRSQFVSSELNSATELYRRVSVMLEQLQAEAHGPAQISPISEARPPLKPTRDPRLTLMAVAPTGLLVALVGLFTLVEARAARVADPDDLESRLRLDVLGVVPPLPAARPPRQPRALDDHRRHFHEYVQSLDHLRVVLCASARGGGRRCIMITSAQGGEGKTTLATQLAGRCANAGLATLLIDADLRKPSLGRLLEVAEGPGLCEILAGAMEAEEALIPIGRGGGFHLLPAGSGHDPSRILEGDRLGQLIVQLRAAYDVVLIDVPPILPVPDALLIGRWADGAVLAVRHGISRVPLVEIARRRLTALGIPVFGAVVSGCRPAESAYYGHYAYGASDAAGAGTEAG